MSRKLRYAEFWDEINVDAVEEAVGFSPEYTRGDNDVGFCIWPDNHANGDTTGKFAIHREDRLYNCYVCGGGDFLSLAMEHLGTTSVEEATEWLHQFTEADMRSDQQFVDDFMDAFRDVEKRTTQMPFFNDRVLDRFNDPLDEAYEWDDEKEDWVPFLEKRCILPEVAERAGVRFCEEMTRPSPMNGKYADEPMYVGPGIIFPHYWKARLVGWQVRWLDPDRPDWIPKYTNTTEFPRETTIYGWDRVMEDQIVDQPIVVVESVPSSLFLESCGFPSVATFGSNVNEAQLRCLRRLPGVVLCPDNDIPKNAEAKPAGIKWRDSLTEYLKRYTTVWHLPPVGDKAGADIGDYARFTEPDRAVQDYLSQKYEPGIDL